MQQRQPLIPGLFPHDEVPSIGELAARPRIAAVMAETIKASPYTRGEIVGRMSLMLNEHVTEAMLNQYTAPSRDSVNISFARAIAFDRATNGHALTSLMAELIGGRFIHREKAALLEVAEISMEEKRLARRRKALQDLLADGRK